MLEINNLSVSYGKNAVLHQISMKLDPGQIVVLVGESGSGKTTLIKTVLGLNKSATITEGEIHWKGASLIGDKEAKRHMEQIRGREIAMIYQSPEESLDPIMQIGTQIHEALRADGKISRRESDDLAREMFLSLNFQNPKEILKSYPFELSGGMCQRVTIAMAMMRHPALLLADEPTSALDVTSQLQTIELLRNMKSRDKTSILLVTHNLGVAAKLADYIGVMQQGHLVEYGLTSQVLHQPQNPYTRQLIAAVPKLKKEELIHGRSKKNIGSGAFE